MTERLDYWAEVTPDRIFLAERGKDGTWRSLTYREFRRNARDLAQALLDRHLDVCRPIALLFGNSLKHALLAVAALYAGIPYSPISPAYLSLGTKLKQHLDSIQPQLILSPEGEQLLPVPATSDVDKAQKRVTAKSIAKLLFTSGSTGAAKAVINTHGMLTSNQAMLRQSIPVLAAHPPVLCDWLPWHHTFGGNHNFGLVMYNGGTLYIDSGKPRGIEFKETIRNLEEIAPTAYFNVPRGFEQLAKALQQNAKLRDCFFSRLDFLFCAAAELPQSCSAELQRIAFDACGRHVPILTGYGATETAPMVMIESGGNAQPGLIGKPAPGVQVKLSPFGDRYELRVQGPNVFPGYWNSEPLTREAFDEEGFYRTGDLARVENGMLFLEGRLSENFKLSTGTWVNVSELCAMVTRLCPSVQYVVIAGHGRSEITALLFAPEGIGLELLNTAATGSSQRIARVVILPDTLSIESGTLTGKGCVNQAQALQKYAHLVEDLYTFPLPAHVKPICATSEAILTGSAEVRPRSVLGEIITASE